MYLSDYCIKMFIIGIVLITLFSHSFCQSNNNQQILPFFPDRLFSAANFSLLIDYNCPNTSEVFNDNDNTTCTDHLKIIFNYLVSKKPPKWLLEMLDSFGRQESGLSLGNFHWTGDYRLCKSINVPKNDLNYGLVLEGHYCTAIWSIKNGHDQQFTFNSGVCLPKTCQNANKSLLIKVVKVLSNIKHDLINISCLDHDNIDYQSLICILIILFFISLVIIATILHNNLVHFVSVKKSRFADLAAILGCFSLQSNYPLLISADKNDLLSVHIIRIMATISVFLIHFHLNGRFFTRNPNQLFRPKLSNFLYPLLHGSQSVDTFFTLTGLLISYKFFLSSPHNHLQLLHFYLSRYIRLTPSLAIIILIHSSLLHRTASGPFWDYGKSPLASKQICPHNWWSNLLYVNNLIGFNGMVS